MTASIILRTLTYTTGVRSIALAGFKIVSLILRNGFVPSGEASHAVAGITRPCDTPRIPDSPAGFLESGRGHRGGASPLTLQLPFVDFSESMGNHDSKIVDAASVD